MARNRKEMKIRWGKFIEKNYSVIISGILFVTVSIIIIMAVCKVQKKHRAEEKFAILASQTMTNMPIQEEVRFTADMQDDIEETEENEEMQENSIFIPNKQIDFARLQQEVNQDIYAWVYIPDTVIDYPVLQHPEDNSHYLFFNIDGSKGYPGCIYTENYNAKSFEDFNTILYGHNMKDGSMFAGLHTFEDEKFFEEHPYIYIYLEDRVLVYGIFAAYEFSDTHLLAGIDVKLDDDRRAYLEQLLLASNQGLINDTFMPESILDHIITLSTCIRGKSDKRYLVQGILLNEKTNFNTGKSYSLN